ncbi:2-methyl-6-phytyl-1,4-hydroquinone methyltransferase [Halomicronema hongdechloris C2206]|uniref:2-methyl-6-phytyl-1,4-hydroquinone methyltransferase n=1 Tax=Halomicronema hongdechloris C2206 TaxID=1641165 RepID=A0A1Z3HIX3_9CYAN|nr:class I SAM-dependent methyltransferase [Halomicronema hongdechloris]ASC70057.1 2-methyl-6-phytyl-1,4-hydroquinone methyltransferase [Halomicronema hongdechloris C2206]
MPLELQQQKARFFDLWAPRYDWMIPSVFYQAVHQRLLSYVTLPATPHVLDIGCGTGRLLRRLGTHYPALTGVGLDVSAEMLRQARSALPDTTRFDFVQGRSDAMPLSPAEFDAAFCTISFLHYPDPARVLDNIRQILKPQGRFYLADYAPSRWSGQNRQYLPLSPGGLRFYNATAREQLGSQVNLPVISHHYLLGPVMLTIFRRS